MCGIFGYVGSRNAGQIVVQGLEFLQYRGYDSVGAAVANSNDFDLRRCVGTVSQLATELEQNPTTGSLAIGHTRWATHGKVTERNAHPHLDPAGRVAIVHNGIVENHLELKRELSRDNAAVFSSETDSEVIAHLIAAAMGNGDRSLPEAASKVAMKLEGSQAFAATSLDDPGTVVAIRMGNAGGFTVGYGEDENYVSSDLGALLRHTSRVSYLEPGEMAVITRESVTFRAIDGGAREKAIEVSRTAAGSMSKSGFEHFMLKEIHEQPEVIAATTRPRLRLEPPDTSFEDFQEADEWLRTATRVVLVGMGTANYAAQVGRHWFEQFGRLSAESDDASEFRYRDAAVGKDVLTIAVTQSGETADTLAAMKRAKDSGSHVVAVVNVAGSQAVRMADATVMTHADAEFGVAATKTFTAQLSVLLLLALRTGRLRGVISTAELKEALFQIARLPDLVGEQLAAQSIYSDLAERWAHAKNFLFMGRGTTYPIALEAALKLQEISYIHSHGYTAGLMKHGPIALVDDETPVVALCPPGPLYRKMMSNVQQIVARGGRVIAVASKADDEVSAIAEDVIWVPEVSSMLAPVAYVVPVQLLAYHIAVSRGRNVDQPRNLAKSVTVE